MKTTSSPVFIGGLQRSGTSLLRGILGSSKELAIYEWDVPFFTEMYTRFSKVDLKDVTKVAGVIEEIVQNPKVQEGTIPVDADNILSRCVESLDSLTVGKVYEIFFQEYAEHVGRPRWGLKTPHNEFHAARIFGAFPNAKMVQMVRDPRDVAVSYRSYNDGQWHYNVIEHVEKWKRSVVQGLRNKNKYGKSYLMVRYEDLVTDPVRIVKQLCESLELEYTPQMLGMSGHLGWSGNNSFFSDLSQGSRISNAAIGRYRSLLPNTYIDIYQMLLKKEMTLFSYQDGSEGFGLVQWLKFSVVLTWSFFELIGYKVFGAIWSFLKKRVGNNFRKSTFYLVYSRIKRRWLK